MANSIRALALLATFALAVLFGLVGCYPVGGGPLYRPQSGLVVTLYGVTFDGYSIPVLECEYTSRQFSGTRDCGASYVPGGSSITGFVFSAPLANAPETVTVSAMVSVNGATPVPGMCDMPRYLEPDVSYVSGPVWNTGQNVGAPNRDCEIRVSGF